MSRNWQKKAVVMYQSQTINRKEIEVKAKAKVVLLICFAITKSDIIFNSTFAIETGLLQERNF